MLTTGPVPDEPPPAEHLGVPGYKILGELGRGGMGVVYKAVQLNLKRVVALKCILSGGHAGSDELARFRTEAEAVACLQHPNIVQIYEVGEHEGRPYFSLEFCPGGSLADRLQGTPWPPPEAARLVEKLARAMHAAHQQGIVHRDLKPANVLLAAPAGAAEPSAAPGLGEPKVTDFGLAKKVDEVSQTQSGTVMGTPSYMAPEQARGKNREVGPHTDVYALGSVLYELLTGRPPFRAPTALDTILQVINHDPVPPRRLQPRCPRDLETVCLKCLQKDPRKRYPSALDLAEDLQRFLAGEPIRARPTPAWERVLKWARRRPATAALIGAFLLAVLALLAGSWVYNNRLSADRAAALVRSLGSADTAQVPRLIDDLGPYRRWADPLLRRLADDETADPAVRLRASLALVPVDPGQVDYLRRRLLDCSVREFPLVRDGLRPYSEELSADLWAALRDSRRPARARFLAGLALADYEPDSDGWEKGGTLVFLTGQLLEAERDDQADLRRNLRPLAGRLLGPLEALFHDPRARTTVRLAAADALADFDRADPARLAQLASAATPEQYDVLRSALLATPNREAARATLLALAREQPAPGMEAGERVALGRRRAGAAITLMHLGERQAACDVFRVGPDPEALTQFVHGLRDHRLGPGALLESLDRATDPQVRFGLLLALGEFRPEELPSGDRGALLARLRDWYRADPRSSIHGACGWLLRSWGLGAEAARVDRTPLAYDPSGRRKWFVERVGEDTFTFVVFRPGEFRMGSPPSEPYRHPNERQHRVRLTRPFAVCDRELSTGQYARFLRATGSPPPEGDEPVPRADFPMVRVTWPEAALYCRWLSGQAGLDEGRQCYELGPGGSAADVRVQEGPFYPERTGFRLPTEAEWEYACRAGTVTAYGFGNDRGLLVYYGRHLETGPAPGGQLRPNLRGLFDMHGNVWEWCHDHYWPLLPDAVDPVGPAEGKNRVLRGGGWDRSAWHCRSAYRHSPTPDYRGSYMGFRLARTLPGPVPGQSQAGGSGSRPGGAPAGR
jgi:serine/threonine protein kinase/formylglycine-generating enzyme required for sulfatase activity